MNRKSSPIRLLALLLVLLLALPLAALADVTIDLDADGVLLELDGIDPEDIVEPVIGPELSLEGIPELEEAKGPVASNDGPAYKLEGSCVVFARNESLTDVITEAEEGAFVCYGLDEGAVDIGQYFTGTFISNDVEINDEHQFGMPAHDVRVYAILAEQEDYTVDLRGGAAVALPELLGKALSGTDESMPNPPDGKAWLDLNGDGAADAEVDLSANTVTRLAGADSLTGDEAVTLDHNVLFKYKSVTFLFASDPPPKHTLTVNYVYADGSEAAKSHTESVEEGAAYSVASPSIEGYTPDKATVTGTMGKADVTVKVTYAKNPTPKHTLTVNYVYADGTKATDAHTESVEEGAAYSVASPSIEGYTPDKATVTGTMGKAAVTVKVTYAKNPTPKHTLTVNYVYADGTKATDAHTESVEEGAAYSVASPAIEGYTPDKATVTGTMGNADVTEKVTYSKNPAPTHKLTVKYVYADGTKAADSHVETLAEGAKYEVKSPTIQYCTPDKASVKGTMGTANVTEKVVYKRKTCKITFKTNNGTGTMAAQTVQCNVKTKLNACKFKCEGYTFTGWNTKSDGAGKAYKNKAQVTFTKDTTLYARWVKTHEIILAKKTIDFKLKSKMTLKIKAKYKNNGKVKKGVELKLVLSGKVFSAKTNGKGIATFTVSWKFLNKLKTKKYNYTVQYGNIKVRGTVTRKK